MLLADSNYIDLSVIHQIFYQNIWYVIRMLGTSYILFYWLPIKLFPQEYTGGGIQKIVYNFVYMVSYIEVVFTFLIFIKIFSIVIFILVMLLTKLAFMKWYYKDSIGELFFKIRTVPMVWVMDLLDGSGELKDYFHFPFRKRWYRFQKQITIKIFLENLLFYSVFIYIFSVLIARGMFSYSDPSSDTSQFIEWVNTLQENILFSDTKSFGADFYGQAIIIYFVRLFTNIDQIILFSIFPLLLIIALYSAIFYVVKDFTNSKYVALFAVMIHGIVLMSPLSDTILGNVVRTSHPEIINYFQFHFYLPLQNELITNGNSIGKIPYLRYISGLAYEMASVFVLLNAYFLIKVFQTALDRYMYMYALTLTLVFTFHGGGAITLVFVSALIAINAFIFRKISWSLLKQGTLYILLATLVGNLWMLSMIKYGIPQDFGAAAPFIDKLLHTQKNYEKVVQTGSDVLSLINITWIQLVMFGMLAFAYVVSLLAKKRFVYSSILLIVAGTFLVYFITDLGGPLVADQSRLAEYVFFGITLLFTFYFYIFIYKPLTLSLKHNARPFILGISYIVFIVLTLTIPTWVGTNDFWKNINEIGYTSAPQAILKIDNENRPFSWTVIAYVQEFSKVRNKGYHINTQDFIRIYSPESKYLEVPTQKVYIFVENYPNNYMGLHQWYYRWRPEIQRNIKTWIALYSLNHSNIKIFMQTKTMMIYEIDNEVYMDYLIKSEKKKIIDEKDKK